MKWIAYLYPAGKGPGRWLRRSGMLLACVLILFLVAEAGVRFAGLGDFPIYDVDEEIGYVPAPMQSGSYLRRAEWALNERSMLSYTSAPQNGDRAILLLGDSVVWGSNPMPMSERLGSALARELGGKTGPVAAVGAGSWSVLNEQEYLRRLRPGSEIYAQLVWVVNPGDFSGRSVWASNLLHPRDHPWVLSAYLVRKALSSPAAGFVPDVNDGDSLRAFETALTGWALQGLPVLVVWYPWRTRIEDAEGTLKTRVAEIVRRSGADWSDFETDPARNAALYSDARHLDSQGNKILAGHISGRLIPILFP